MEELEVSGAKETVLAQQEALEAPEAGGKHWEHRGLEAPSGFLTLSTH